MFYASKGIERVREENLETVPGGREARTIELESGEGKKIKKKDLINILNFHNFQDKTILVNFRHRKYNHIVSYLVKPEACEEESIYCTWAETPMPVQERGLYEFDHLLLNDGRSHIIISTEVQDLDAKGIRLHLPEYAFEKSRRGVTRHRAESVAARILQNGMMFEGSLVDFCAASFQVSLKRGPTQSFQWINPDSPVIVMFEKKDRILYSGTCGILRHNWSDAERLYVLTPQTDNIRRFRPKEHRSLRHHTVPAPNISFRHPLTEKPVFLHALDLSSSGLAVEEAYENSVLPAGLILPEVSIEIAGNFVINCSAQVLYRKVVPSEHGRSIIKCGIALLDMEIEDQARLSALLHQATNPKSYVCNQVDMEALWQFFFESGFIYPSKYAALQSNKEEFKKTYKSLYLHSPSIARHFVFQDKGSLFGHMSMIRFYSNSWLIHHHAASKRGPIMAGLEVLDQVGSYVNEFHTLYSTHMDFVICYFQPENRFPNRVFGGVVHDIGNQKGASLDTFAYLHLSDDAGRESTPYQVFPANSEDLQDLTRCYENFSAGLMLDALDIKPGIQKTDDLSIEYARLGFKRERHLFSLKQDDTLKAVLMLTISDLGLNLSNLTSCVQAFVLDQEGLSPSTLKSAVLRLRRHFGRNDLPLLVYPADYADNRSVPYEKKYTLWVLNTQSLDGYFASVQNTFKRMPHG